jgi:hypothetical protein
MKKFFLITLIIILIVGAAVFSFLYWGVYDEGIRAGTVLRISRKGVIFKTYEGQLNLQSFGAMKSGSPFMETFDFSVERNMDQVIKDLEAVALTGERVNLRYIKRFIAFPWRGETKYYVKAVERTDTVIPARQSFPAH